MTVRRDEEENERNEEGKKKTRTHGLKEILIVFVVLRAFQP